MAATGIRVGWQHELAGGTAGKDDLGAHLAALALDLPWNSRWLPF
jgi:hypothetical protein